MLSSFQMATRHLLFQSHSLQACRSFGCYRSLTPLFVRTFHQQFIFNHLLQPVQISMMPCRQAGHSKWQNIKHTKLAKDMAKSQLFARLCQQLRKAVQKNNSGDPHLNKDLADVLESCRRAKMPSDTIDRNIKRALEKKAENFTMELLGPNNCLLILDFETLSFGLFRSAVKKILKKYPGWGFVKDARKDFAFKEIGFVKIGQVDKNGVEISLEKAEEIAIEAEAEEVTLSEDNTITFISTPFEYTKVKKYITENTQLDIVEAGNELIPLSKIELNDAALQQASEIIEKLEEMEEVTRVYDNIL